MKPANSSQLPNDTPVPQRIETVDVIKGAMILAMVGYHFLYDLVYFCGLPLHYFHNPVCDTIQFLICSTFILCSGALATVSHNHVLHALRIGIGALIITVTTYVFDSSNFVVFGILHFLACANLFYALLYRGLNKIPRILSLLLWTATFAIAYFLFPLPTQQPHLWIFGWIDQNFYSSDYFPIFPWIFLFFLGTWFGKPIFSKQLPLPFYSIRSKPLAWCGKYSFWIYMVHQPLLMGIVFLIQSLSPLLLPS